MADTYLNFDAGPEGTAVSTANSGATTVNLGTGGTAVYAAAAATRGPFGARTTNGAGSTVTIRAALAASNVQLTYLAPHRISTVTGEYSMVDFRHSAGINCLIKRHSTNNIEWWWATALGGETGVVVLPATQVTAGALYWVSARLNSTSGAYNIKIYDANAALLNEVSGTRAFATTNPFTHVQQGANGAAARTIDVDEIRVGDGSTAEYAIPPVTVTPTGVWVTGTVAM